MKKQNLALVLAGMMLGAALSGPAANAAEQLLAQRSTQKIYVDGRQTPMEAYSINGSNYVKLRDIGRAVGFAVSYDAADNAVRINTGEPYAEDAPAQASRVVQLPTDGSKYIPQVGDLIPYDGTFYEVKDTLRWENSVFAPGPLPELPAPSYD